MMRIEPHENVSPTDDHENETIRARRRRPSLDAVVTGHQGGAAAPEALVEQYEFLAVDTTRRILEWYHTRKDEVDAYIEHNVAKRGRRIGAGWSSFSSVARGNCGGNIAKQHHSNRRSPPVAIMCYGRLTPPEGVFSVSSQEATFPLSLVFFMTDPRAGSVGDRSGTGPRGPLLLWLLSLIAIRGVCAFRQETRSPKSVSKRGEGCEGRCRTGGRIMWFFAGQSSAPKGEWLVVAGFQALG